METKYIVISIVCSILTLVVLYFILRKKKVLCGFDKTSPTSTNSADTKTQNYQATSFMLTNKIGNKVFVDGTTGLLTLLDTKGKKIWDISKIIPNFKPYTSQPNPPNFEFQILNPDDTNQGVLEVIDTSNLEPIGFANVVFTYNITNTGPYTLLLQDNGNLIFYDKNSNIIFQTCQN
jgi:hypothetical protein